ncbi:Protein wos2, partial [Smittium mucronatum]
MSKVNYPAVKWAQRANLIYLTISLPDCKVAKFDLTPESLDFAGTSNGTEYAFKIDFYAPIDVQASKHDIGQRSIFCNLAKQSADEEQWWPRLQKGPKLLFVKTDFDLWVDEDESEDEAPAGGAGGNPMMPPGMDFSQFGGMPGMEGLAG